MLECLRPDTEFLSIVSKGDNAIFFFTRRIAKNSYRFINGCKGNRITQCFRDWKDCDLFSEIFCEIISGEIGIAESSSFEMCIINDDIINVRLNKRRNKLLLPYTLGKPETGGIIIEMFFDE